MMAGRSAAVLHVAAAVSAAAAVCLVAAGLNDYWLRITATAANFAIVALAWGFLLGFAGQLNFAPAAIWGAGAYAAAILMTRYGWNAWAAVIGAAGCGALIGAILVLPAMRLQRIYLGLFTLGFGELMRLAIINEAQITQGPSGFGLSSVRFGGLLDTGYGMLVVTVCLLATAYLFFLFLLRSRHGLYFQAMRDDQVAADARGVNIALCKFWAFFASSIVMALAGALFAYQSRYVSPEMLHVEYSFQFIVMSLFGGVRTLIGPIVGAAAITFLLDLLRAWEAWRLVLLGMLVCANVLVFPHGVVGALWNYIHYRRADSLLARRFGQESHFKVAAPDQASK